MMNKFNLNEYEPVEERIKKFYKDYPDGRIHTSIEFDDGTRILIMACIYRDHNNDTACWTTGFAEEIRGEGYVNKTSAVENCETSAIGRALANANYAGSKRPSREEMVKATTHGTQTVKPAEMKMPLVSSSSPIKTDAITEAQRRKIFQMLRDTGTTEEADQRLALKELTGKDSTRDLTKKEASKVIEALS